MSTSTSPTDVVKLLAAKRTIEVCLRTNREELKMLQKSRRVSVEDLLKESLQIQFNCHAPKEYTIGMPLFKSHPPAPQPEEMRVGALSLYNKSQSNIYSSEKYDHTKTEIVWDAVSVLNSLRSELSSKRNRPSNDQIGIPNSSAAPESIAEDENAAISDRIAEEDNFALKKARTVNISFGMSDSEESDSD